MTASFRARRPRWRGEDAEKAKDKRRVVKPGSREWRRVARDFSSGGQRFFFRDAKANSDPVTPNNPTQDGIKPTSKRESNAEDSKGNFE